jgi:hypothetical protein
MIHLRSQFFEPIDTKKRGEFADTQGNIVVESYCNPLLSQTPADTELNALRYPQSSIAASRKPALCRPAATGSGPPLESCETTAKKVGGSNASYICV